MGATFVPAGASMLLLSPALQLDDDGQVGLFFLLWAPLIAALGGYQWFLTVTRGQTVGKRFCGIRIVHIDNSPVGFVSGVVLRGWVPAAISWAVALVGIQNWLFWLVDCLLIFTPGRRTLHDRIAGTKVIIVEPPTPRETLPPDEADSYRSRLLDTVNDEAG
jgi:uncharacterized RDD family membrane protein YckC